jgi:DNA-binding response OmpR family regulator
MTDPRPPVLPPATVLVVDDEAMLRHVLERVLVQLGYRVIGAASAETAYELLASEQPDALLLDIQLPTMSGLALYLAIVHRWPSLEGRIAIMTGDAEAEDVRTWLERHPCTVIRKPFNMGEVTDWLDDVLRRGPERQRGKAEA